MVLFAIFYQYKTCLDFLDTWESVFIYSAVFTSVVLKDSMHRCFLGQLLAESGLDSSALFQVSTLNYPDAMSWLAVKEYKALSIPSDRYLSKITEVIQASASKMASLSAHSAPSEPQTRITLDPKVIASKQPLPHV